MNYWLFKSEPNTYGIDDLFAKPQHTDSWEGVRNYQARNFIRDDIKIGDYAFFYHSNSKPPGIIGIMQVVTPAYPDLEAFNVKSKYYDAKSSMANPRWYCVNVKFIHKFAKLISLETIKNHPILKNMLVAKQGNRLSITPVKSIEWQEVLKLANYKPVSS